MSGSGTAVADQSGSKTIVLAILLSFRRNRWPHGAVLGEVPDLGGWHSTAEHPDADELPGIHVEFVEMRDRLQDLLQRYGLDTTLDQEHFDPNLQHALGDIRTTRSSSEEPPDEGTQPT